TVVVASRAPARPRYVRDAERDVALQRAAQRAVASRIIAGGAGQRARRAVRGDGGAAAVLATRVARTVALRRAGGCLGRLGCAVGRASPGAVDRRAELVRDRAPVPHSLATRDLAPGSARGVLTGGDGPKAGGGADVRDRGRCARRV